MKKKITPLMQQFFEVKKQYPTYLLLFQVGDFYELFFEDAEKASECLGITLTTRGKHLDESIPLCGVPVHAVQFYLTKLIKAGFSVALCDQLEEATPGKIVARGVTQVYTPGMLTDSALLDDKKSAYLASYYSTTCEERAVIFCEILTGSIYIPFLSHNDIYLLEAELSRFSPEEILISNTLKREEKKQFQKKGFKTRCIEEDSEEYEYSLLWVQQLKENKRVHDFTVSLQNTLRILYAFLKKNHPSALPVLQQFHCYKPRDFLILDAPTMRHLEIVENLKDGSLQNTLFFLIDQAKTPMGSRTLKKWLMRPLLSIQSITMRLDAVQFLIAHHKETELLRSLLKKVGDFERIVGRVALNKASHKDYISLKNVLNLLKQLIGCFDKAVCPFIIKKIWGACVHFESLQLLLNEAINDNLAINYIIKDGFDEQLDALRKLVVHSEHVFRELETKEQQNTGISSLKIKNNTIHGYYIEITKANIELVPERYKRYQTLVGKERFITSELKELEEKLIDAQKTISLREQSVYEHIKKAVFNYVSRLRQCAQGLSYLDALGAFALVAQHNGYVRPEFNDQQEIRIHAGRHPVVEQQDRHHFIANDTCLDNAHSTWIITGPNMGGKSTYLRQVAHIALLAHCGSFVPAEKASLSILDRIFTRIGASDNVAEGKSTFLVEMEETATICKKATQKSLVILDEIGRGTSTFDGLAIAQAVVEYLHTIIGARCLFATHYHELTSLSDTIAGIVNYYAASKNTAQGIVLLHKIKPGIADGSFGIEVAKCVQLPASIITRAITISQELRILQEVSTKKTEAIYKIATQLQE